MISFKLLLFEVRSSYIVMFGYLILVSLCMKLLKNSFRSTHLKKYMLTEKVPHYFSKRQLSESFFSVISIVLLTIAFLNWTFCL